LNLHRPTLGCELAIDLMVLYVELDPPSTMYVASVHGAPHRQGASCVPLHWLGLGFMV
jgi:hypothetical protein